ncbi:CapA family protein [Serratia liquefaciens]|uniref:CapA family protein n=1 Tax=Serratia liquefaciens TaxID=614 RepID=UPI002183F539|nr:CapA family protein [Serratia liquefaciens]CAI2540268.1 Bacterial capsule synthesis protein PGA_cap [Serratia liquefaciens]
MNWDLIEALREAMPALDIRLDEHEDEIITTLQLVAKGELRMPETLSPEEAEHTRAIFDWVATVGPQKVWAKIQPVLADPATSKGEIALNKIFVDSELAANPPPLGDRIDKRALTRLAVLLMSYIFYEQFHYPQPETGVYNIADNTFEKIKWVYRYWFNQLEVAEKGSGIEDVFASQDLSELAKKKPSNAACISFSCAGDLLAVDVLKPENTEKLFDDITDFYSTTDIVSANLESTVDCSRPVGRTQNPGEPARMNTSQEMFEKFRSEAKINLFSTATNHALDWEEHGVLATLDVLAASGARYTGTARSPAQRNEITIVKAWPKAPPPGEEIEDYPTIQVGILSFTMDLNGFKTPPKKSYLVNEVRFNDVDPAPDYTLIKDQVAAARKKGVDWIIAYVHWGWEFEMYPHVNIREAARKIIACGVDTILGNHAHVSQPAELIPRPGQQDALVIYSFGDFV